jgi:hypothetical protein
MPIARNTLDPSRLNLQAKLPYELRLEDFRLAAQDVYDFFYDVNTGLTAKGLERLDDTLRPAIMSGVLSDMLTASLAKHSRTLTVNAYFNGHPDLVVRGQYPNNAVKASEQGSRSRRRARLAALSIRTARATNGCASSSTRSMPRLNRRSTAGR